MAFIFVNYYTVEKEHLREQLFLQMKNYSFSFEGDRFDMDIVPKVPKSQLYELYFDEQNLYILTPFPKEENVSVAILYPLKAYDQELAQIRKKLLIQALLLSVVSALVSLMFTLYTLSPLRASLRLLEEFIKDIIHDLNTPITSILINLKMMERNEEVESIEQSAKAIAMLHKNLDLYLRESQFEMEQFTLGKVIQEQVAFFQPLYNHLQWIIDIQDRTIHSNKNALSRILYNLISNACKYNRSQGFIKIETQGDKLIITNSSYGIKNPSRVFERFYKEGERGLGIGLHIVEKLCEELKIKKSLTVQNNEVKVVLVLP